jgi:hypothetical protein
MCSGGVMCGEGVMCHVACGACVHDVCHVWRGWTQLLVSHIASSHSHLRLGSGDPHNVDTYFPHIFTELQNRITRG